MLKNVCAFSIKFSIQLKNFNASLTQLRPSEGDGSKKLYHKIVIKKRKQI